MLNIYYFSIKRKAYESYYIVWIGKGDFGTNRKWKCSNGKKVKFSVVQNRWFVVFVFY